MTVEPRVVRVPRAWGAGGDAMTHAATMPLPFPDAATIDAEPLEVQNRLIADALPERPVVLGGCCCAHVGAVRGLAQRHGRIAVVWFDAHGDLNTPESSPSGNVWGMPYRMVLDAGDVAAEDAALIGARSLDQPEEEFIARVGLATALDELDRVLDGVTGAYVALDCDVFEPSQIACFMPEPGGPTIEDVEGALAAVSARVPVVGFGFTGLVEDPRNPPLMVRLLAAAGFAA
jgi:arginase